MDGWMAMDRKVLSAWVPKPLVVILLVVLLGLPNCPVTIVNAFHSTSAGRILSVHPNSHNSAKYHRPTPQIETCETVLWARLDPIEIRDFRLTDQESKTIYNFLLRREQDERAKSKLFFDPEGSLEIDVSNKYTLAESYSKDDGGCFLVAVEGDSDGKTQNERIVGTLGMISGNQVLYQSSGSSFSQAEITAAFRRVCALDMGDNKERTNEILEALIRRGEQRALQSGATNLICMAYPEVSTKDNNSDFGDGRNIVKPTLSLFQSLGYTVSEQQIPGVATVQYEKKLSKGQLESDKRAAEVQWIIPAIIASVVSFGWLVFNLYSNVFGIEQLWGSVDNGGVGTSLSSETLEQLIRDEKLGRSALDESGLVRQWEDLSPEELREEQALMKVIQGQSIRTK